MSDKIIQREIQIEIMKFFLKTSIPRILKTNTSTS